jgi:DNA primase
MALIPEQVITDVADRADILRTVGGYVTLKRAGTVHKGLCPFHQEKTPSFIVTASRGTFKCFGCGASGTIFGFLMQIEGLNFPEAVRKVAAEVGVEVPDLREGGMDASERDARQKRRDAYIEVQTTAQEWFADNLWRDPDSDARRYLASRGVDQETAKTFGLGYAPDTWTGLLDHMRRRKISPEACEAAGLATLGQRGHRDRFRGRIVFPVYDRWGKVVAFGGRILDPDAKAPKYLNSPETAFYTKGSEVFGLATTKQHIRKSEHAILVEGNFDVIVLYAKGVKNAVAPMGTAMTEGQTRLLGRFSKHVFVAFDGDKAGIAAVRRSLPILLAQEFDARVVTMPMGDDPDSYILREGLDAFQSEVSRAQPIVQWVLDRVFSRVAGAPVEERVEALREAGEVLGHVRERVAWTHYAGEVARRLDLNPGDIDSYLKRPDRLSEREPEKQKDETPLPKLEGACVQVLSLLPDRLVSFAEQDSYQQLFTDERLVYLIERAHAYRKLHPDRVPPMAVLAEVVAESQGDPHFTRQIAQLLEDAEEKFPVERRTQAWGDTVTKLQIDWLAREKASVLEAMKNVKAGSEDELLIARRFKALDEARARLDLRLERKRM